ncbi:MAG: O-antigen ligase family protein [Acidobacteriota bacterium]
MKYKTKRKVEANKDRSGWIRGLVVLYLVLLPFVASLGGFDQFRLPKTVFSVWAILAIVVATMAVGRSWPRFGWLSWEALVIAGLAYVGLHTLISASPSQSWTAFQCVFLFAAFLFCLLPVASPAFQRVAWLSIAGAMGVNAALTVLQFHGLVAEIKNSAGEVISGRMNPAGLIGEVNSGGFLFGLVSLILIYFLVMGKRRVKILAGFLMAMNLGGLAYSRTLTAVAALLICGLIWLAFHHWWAIRREHRFPRSLVYLWIALIAVGGVGLAVGARSGIVSRVRGVIRLAERGEWSVATAGRQPVYLLTWRMIEEEPWLGRGLDTFGQDFFYFRAGTGAGQRVRLLEQPGAFREVHNDYLQVWEELGLPGVILLLALFGIPILRSVQHQRRESSPTSFNWNGLLTIAIVYVMINCLAFFPLRLALTVPYLLLIVAGLRRYEWGDAAIAEAGADRAVSRWGLVASGLAGIFILVVAIQGTLAWSANKSLGVAVFLVQRASSGQFSPQQSRTFADDALARLKQAEDSASWIPELYSLEGTAFMQLGRYDEAAGKYQQAARLIPSSEVLTNLATAYMAERKFDRAEETIRLALNYDPQYSKARDALHFLKDQQSK